MARRKRPEFETLDETTVRKQLEAVTDHATRNEKVSWDRKMDNMVTLLSTLRPIEDKISDLLAQKMPIMDKVSGLRAEMVRECIHPFPQLVHRCSFVECKFCGTKVSLPSTRD